MPKYPKWILEDPKMVRAIRSEVTRNAKHARNTKQFQTSYGINSLNDKAITSSTIGPRMLMGKAAVQRTAGTVVQRPGYINDITRALSTTGKYTSLFRGLPAVVLAADLAGRIKARRKKNAK